MEVVCGVIEKDGSFLIAKRGKGVHEGIWEFPGGKVEKDETNEEAVVREIKEELDLQVKVKKYLTSIVDQDEIHVHAYLCELLNGEVHLNAHSEIKWVRVDELFSYAFSDADKPILKMLNDIYHHSILIENAHIILDEKTELKNGSILIENGKISKVAEKIQGSFSEVIDAEGKLVIPGMIDTHIHGAMGFDFTYGTQEAIDAVAKNLVQDGVTGFLGSLTVVEHSRMMNILKSYSHCHPCSEGAEFLGIHSEGPYLALEYKAVMNPLYIKPYDKKEFEEMCSVKDGLIRSMTFCPNQIGAEQLLEEGKKHHLAMMIGHTNASCQCVLNAIDHGASGYTHLYNAMSQHTHRNPGCVTAAFNSDGYCELITDTIHIDPEVMKMTFNAIGSKRIILVTDAMNAKSLPDGVYNFSDLLIEKKDGKAYVPETGRLAGSTMSLNEGFRNMVEICHASLCEAVEMTCVNPAKVLHIHDHKGSLRVGFDADLCMLDHEFNCVMTTVGGRIVYTADCMTR